MSTDIKNEQNIKEYLVKFEPFIKQMIQKYSKVKFYDDKEIISWAQEGIVQGLNNIPEDCKNVNSYIMSYITNYVKLGLRESGHFINLKSKWSNKDPEIRKINNIVSLDDPISNTNYSEHSGNSFVDIMPSAILTPTEEIEAEEKVKIINDAIDSLREDYSNIVRQHIYEGKTFEEIAKNLPITKQRVEQKYQKALKMLKIPLKDI